MHRPLKLYAPSILNHCAHKKTASGTTLFSAKFGNLASLGSDITHASLGYISPVVYEEMHEMKQNRAA